jgi:hypothetical protein
VKGSILPAGFCIDSAMRSWAIEHVPTVNIDLAHAKFCDYFTATGKTMVSWEACWRNWMRRNLEWGRDLYTADEVRIVKLMDEYTAKGFRRAFKHENSVMYETAYIAWDMSRRGAGKLRDMSMVGDLVQRLSKSNGV